MSQLPWCGILRRQQASTQAQGSRAVPRPTTRHCGAPRGVAEPAAAPLSPLLHLAVDTSPVPAPTGYSLYLRPLRALAPVVRGGEREGKSDYYNDLTLIVRPAGAAPHAVRQAERGCRRVQG